MDKSAYALGSTLFGACALLYIGVQNSIFTVDAGYRAIKFSRFTGLGNKTYREGWHFRIPYFERPIKYDCKTHARELETSTGSKDLQTVHLKIRVLYRPMSDKITEIYRNCGPDYDERVLPSIVNEVLKTAIAQYNAAQLLNQRESVSYMIRRNLEERARDFNIIIDDVSLMNLAFSKEFHAAVEDKQAAQQEAERAKYLVEQALQDKKSLIIQAQGDALSAELIGRQLQKNPAYIELKRIDAARNIAETLRKHKRNTVFLDSSTLLLNLTDPLSQKLMAIEKYEGNVEHGNDHNQEKNTQALTAKK